SRDTQRRAVDPATGALDALAASTRTVITRLAESEEHRAFERAVASLTEEDRFLVAAKLSSQSQEALSRDMGIEAATLRKQVSRAVGRLKEKLSGSSDLPREGNTA
ncbi:MAG: sigma-70 family RNA polymerase sigma factor, partial [bacterium]|nr:sigma-70 family RNA polymerase sigma factor [bacterium]